MQTDNRPSSPDDNVCSFTNAEVMKFLFVEPVCHYMAGNLIGSSTNNMMDSLTNSLHWSTSLITAT
jgi:hypothetical protein